MQLENFNPQLVEAFRRMILGVNIELSEQGKQKMQYTGKYFFIHSIDADEKLTLTNVDNKLFGNMTLSDIWFNDYKNEEKLEVIDSLPEMESLPELYLTDPRFL